MLNEVSVNWVAGTRNEMPFFKEFTEAPAPVESPDSMHQPDLLSQPETSAAPQLTHTELLATLAGASIFSILSRQYD